MKQLQHIRYYGIWLFIAVYACMSLKSILPYATDFLAHHFNESEHMATIHYEHGSYHVHTEVAHNESTKNKEPQSPAPTQGKDVKTDLHFMMNFDNFPENVPFSLDPITETAPLEKNNHAKSRTISPNYPPPQFL